MIMADGGNDGDIGDNGTLLSHTRFETRMI